MSAPSAGSAFERLKIARQARLLGEAFFTGDVAIVYNEEDPSELVVVDRESPARRQGRVSL